jgi:hypothetical protein
MRAISRLWESPSPSRENGRFEKPARPIKPGRDTSPTIVIESGSNITPQDDFTPFSVGCRPTSAPGGVAGAVVMFLSHETGNGTWRGGQRDFIQEG